jgi:hypothetical protein
MGQLLDICPGCIPFCTISCCNCCVPVPPGLVRAVGKHSGLFKALGLSPQQLTVLWHKFQAFDRGEQCHRATERAVPCPQMLQSPWQVLCAMARPSDSPLTAAVGQGWQNASFLDPFTALLGPSSKHSNGATDDEALRRRPRVRCIRWCAQRQLGLPS